jgi:hypothetical protein
MTDNATIADKLDEARALIEKGWCQGAFERRGCFCLYGAISQVTLGQADADSRSTEPLEELVAKAINDGSESWELARWNDAYGRTQAEVIEAFRKAAELARGETSC